MRRPWPMTPWLRTWFWPLLAVVSAIVLLVQLPGPHATAWHFFELAVDLLLGWGPEGDGAGLALYRDHPELQFGPVSILVAVPFTPLGEAGAMVALSALGLVVVRLLLDTIDELVPGALARAHPVVAFSAGLLVVVTWGDVAVRTAHIDDAVALVALMVAVRAVARDQAGAATLAIAVAAAAKPWAVVAIPLAAVPSGPRPWLRPLVAGAAALATWAPFVLAEPATLDTSEFEIRNDPTSVLRALGVDAARTPEWVRPAQLVGGILVVAAVVAWRRWPAGLLAGIAWRLLLDPGAHRYYTVGVVLGGLLVELRARPGRPPWVTAVLAVVLEATAVPDGPVGLGQLLRLGAVLAAFVLVVGAAPAATPGTLVPGRTVRRA